MIMMAALLLISCNNTPAPMPVAELQGEWNIEEVDGEKAIGETAPFIGFMIEEGRLYGSNSCNRINGTINENKEQTAGKLSFGTVASTMMLCANSPMEQTIMNALKKVAQYSGADANGLITLMDENNTPLMKIRRK